MDRPLLWLSVACTPHDMFLESRKRADLFLEELPILFNVRRDFGRFGDE
jgi:hypothetical protein